MNNKSPLGENTDDLGDFFSSFFRDPRKDHRWNHLQIYPPLTEIFRQDEEASAAFLIEKGMVKLIKSVPAGNEIIIGIRQGTSLIGGSAILLGKPYFFTAVTLVRSSLRYIPANNFLHLVKTDNDFSWQITRLVSQALFNCMSRLETIGCMPARDRLETFLCDLILQHENAETEKAIEFTIPLKNQELAQILAVTPEHVSRLFKEMEEEGIVKRNKGTLTIVDPSVILRKSSL